MGAAMLPVAVLALVSAFVFEGVEATLGELQQRFENGSSEAKDFEIQESEANAYLRSQASANLPEGIESPWVRFEDSVAVVGATVDLDRVRGSLPDSMVFQLLSGRVPVEITARLSGEKGIGTLALDRVLFAGIELPPSLVAMMVDGSKADAFLPPGFRLGEPFPLPLDLESLRCLPGTVQLKQGPTTAAKPK
jgi:hypothetical protein